MSSIINTNSLSLLTQNNLLKSQSSLTTAIQRLSSGLRINSAKDDAAGQAIANRFSSNIKGLSQAQRNANDGISLAQTTEGALNEINNNLQRVRELTVQAANGSNSKTDLDSIQSEITQRMAEIDRTSSQTDFNGTKVLGATAATLKIQVGANDGETINIGLQTINTSTLGVASFNINGTGTANTAAAKNDLALNAGWNQGTAGTVGYTTGSAFTAGAADAVTGAVQYTQTVNKVTTAAANAYDVAYTAANRANVFTAVANTGTVKINGGAAALDSFTYATATASYTATTAATVGSTSAGGTVVGAAANAAASGAPVGGVASYLVPTGTEQISASVTVGVGGTAQEIKVASSGNVTDESGRQLYLDTTGNLTQNQGTGAGALRAANIGKGDAGDLLKSMSVGTVGTIGNSTSGAAGVQVKATGGNITVNQASGSTIELNINAFTGATSVKEAFVATFGATVDADTVVFDGISEALTAGQSDAQNASEYTAAYNAITTANFVATVSGANVTFTQKMASDITDKVNADFAVTSGGGGAVTTVAVAGPTSQGVTADQGTGATWIVKQNLTSADMQSKSAAAASTVVDATGGSVAATTYTINGTTGAVTDGASAAVYLSDAGATPASTLTTDTKRTVAAVTQVVTAQTALVYTLQTNGAVMDNAGNRVYKDSDTANVKGFTLTERSGSTATVDALKVIDVALAKVDGLRGSLGAVQNRFDSVISNLGSTITNLSSSRSRIEDADYATEVSNMTRAQILQQAGTSVLAKANQSTQGVMSLLQ